MPFLLYGDEIFSPTTIGFSKGKMVGHIVLKDGVITDPEKLDTRSLIRFQSFCFPPRRKPFVVF
jgi:hypothetical protein